MTQLDLLLVGKCAAQVQTRDLLVRITSNFDKMISHINFVGLQTKKYQILPLTATAALILAPK